MANVDTMSTIAGKQRGANLREHHESPVIGVSWGWRQVIDNQQN
jgi:hypothetical protein